MKPSSAAIVILNWNGQPYLKKYLPEVIQYAPSYADIWVIDNASSDNSVAFLREHYPGVHIIRNSDNKGYAGGYNSGLREIPGEYFILLNSDIAVTEGWIDPVIQFMEDHPEVASCQPKIKSLRQRRLFEYAGAAGGCIDMLGYPFCRGRIFDHCEADQGQYNDPMPVFWSTGACMFIRASVFKDNGGFDERFFAHMEEIDLCWRLLNQGYTHYCIPRSEVYHLGGGSLDSGSPYKTFLNFRNNLMMLLKNLKFSQALWILPARLVMDGLSALRFLLSGNTANFRAVFRAHMAFHASIPHTLRKKRLHSKKPLQHLPGVYAGSLVWQYFVRGRKTFKELTINQTIRND